MCARRTRRVEFADRRFEVTPTDRQETETGMRDVHGESHGSGLADGNGIACVCNAAGIKAHYCFQQAPLRQVQAMRSG